MWRSVPCAIAIAAITTIGSALAAAPPTAAALLAGMAQTPPASTPFIEVSYRSVLDRPLVASGTLHWLGGDALERDITAPFTETAKAGNGELSVQRGTGKVHRVPLARAPQVGAMLAGFRALLDGDAASLERDFSLSVAGTDARWVITLAPRDAALRKRLASIGIDGAGHAPNCLVVSDANGDTTVTLLGGFARAGLPQPVPQQAALLARCRSGQ